MPLETVELPLAGKIIEVNFKTGDNIKEGDIICLVESMKMENPIPSPISGIVKEIRVSVGSFAGTDDVLAIIEY